MHTHSIDRWAHDHVFLGVDHDRHERRTWLVVILTATMMVAEIIGGNMFGSMAVVADGWHMSTHATALTIAALSYRFARQHAHDPRFSFGTGKLGELAGFASAIILVIVALFIGYESVTRLLAPVPIRFGEATIVAVIGLAVNLLSAWLLFDDDHHHGAHDAEHAHKHDTNIRAAYLHVLADALTSVLAILALLGGRFFNWVWLDPIMGIVGALFIAHWSRGLIVSAGAVLLDTVPSQKLATAIRERLECGDDRVSDLHLWRLGPGHSGLIVTIISHRPQSPAIYKEQLAGIDGLSHITVEVHACQPQTMG